MRRSPSQQTTVCQPKAEKGILTDVFEFNEPGIADSDAILDLAHRSAIARFRYRRG